MIDIKAIETVYKGYRFRSRLEARWAVFFDAIGLEWEYEKEGYHLYGGMKYLPDFWFPKHEMFVEIKGTDPTDAEKELAFELCMGTGFDVLIFYGNIGVDAEGLIYSFSESDGEVNVFEDNSYQWHMAEMSCGWCRNRPEKIKPGMFDVIYANSHYIDFSGEERIINAYKMARSARFEFGENGEAK